MRIHRNVGISPFIMLDIANIRLDHTGLRRHQVDAKERIFEAWQSCDSVMLQMPTGTGKTYLFTSIINDIVRNYKAAHEEINILVVAHRTELLDQISATLSRFDIAHGFIQGAREQHLWKRVQVGSIMSLLTDKNYYNTLKQRFDFIIVDEAHHSLAESYVSLFEMFPKAKKLGVTATPWRFNHESFLKLYEQLIETPTVAWFINNNLLSDFEYVSIKPDSEIQRLVDMSSVALTGDFVNSDLDNSFNNQRIRSKLYESYKRHAYGRKGIVYAINKVHAAKIADMYSSHGINAVAIDCDTPKEDRQRLISLFKEDVIQILVNVDIFTEGFDVPDISFIQLARPTRSLALYLQQVGRALRIVKGKEKAIILDNVGLYNYFGLPDAKRNWKLHFRGREDVEAEARVKRSGREVESNLMLDESKFDEDDENMLIVRGVGSAPTETTESAVEEDEVLTELPKVIEPEEFIVANYYLIRGSRDKFKIYPFQMKRGKITHGVGNSLYEYSHEKEDITLSNDVKENEIQLKTSPKLLNLVQFAFAFKGLNPVEVFKPNLVPNEMKDEEQLYTPFEILKRLSQI